jgi:hypothetical protein
MALLIPCPVAGFGARLVVGAWVGADPGGDSCCSCVLVEDEGAVCCSEVGPVVTVAGAVSFSAEMLGSGATSLPVVVISGSC